MSGHDAGIGISFIVDLVFHPKYILDLRGHGAAAVGNDLAQSHNAPGPAVVRIVPCFGTGHVAGAAGDHLCRSLVAYGPAASDDGQGRAAVAAVEAWERVRIHQEGARVYEGRSAQSLLGIPQRGDCSRPSGRVFRQGSGGARTVCSSGLYSNDASWLDG